MEKQNTLRSREGQLVGWGLSEVDSQAKSPEERQRRVCTRSSGEAEARKVLEMAKAGGSNSESRTLSWMLSW